MQDHQAAVPWTLGSLCFFIWGRAGAGVCGPGSGLMRGRRKWVQGMGAGVHGRVDVGPALSPGALKPLRGLQGQAVQG